MKARVWPHLSPCNVYVEKSATGKMFPSGTSVSTASVIPPMLYTHFRLHVAVTRRTNARILGTSPKVMLFCLLGNIGHKNTFTCLLVFKGLMTKLQRCRTATSYTTSLTLDVLHWTHVPMSVTWQPRETSSNRFWNAVSRVTRCDIAVSGSRTRTSNMTTRLWCCNTIYLA